MGVRRGAVISAAGIILYILLVGANPAVVRAAILGIFTLLGYPLGCHQNGWIEITTDGTQMWVEAERH